MKSRQRILLVAADSFSFERLSNIALGTEPRIDFMMLAESLRADLLTYDGLLPYSAWDRKGHEAPISPGSKPSKGLLGLAREAAQRAPDYDALFLSGEDLAIPVAGLLRNRPRPALVALGHYLNPAKKWTLLRALGSRIDRLVLYSPVQHLFAEERLRMPGNKLEVIPFHADTEFYCPGPGLRRDRMLVVAAGKERRDYATLFEAAVRSGSRLEIGAGSPWSRFRRTLPPLPPNTVNRYRTRAELRHLYQRAGAVVVPLFDTDFQAGISVAIEAMSCGAPVIVSRSAGLAHLFRDGDQGLFVTPEDPGTLTQALLRLQTQPALGERIGANARRLVQQTMSTEHWVDRLSWIIRRTIAGSATSSFFVLPCHQSIRLREVA